MTEQLGACDPFINTGTLPESEVRDWIERLEQRAAEPDQGAMRAQLLELAAVQPGDTAVEVGCGTGVLLVELARAVGPGGKAVGIEPQPGFAAAARERLRRAGLEARAEVLVGSAERLDLPDGVSAACLAQTVLLHLPGPVLRASLQEMVRVTRPGGRVVSIDQDGDTWVVDHPDRELTRRIARFSSDQRYADGWTGRRLHRLFTEAGLTSVEVHPMIHQETSADSYMFGMAERLALAAAEAGAVESDEAEAWIGRLRELADRGLFYSSINYYACAGVRPSILT